MKRPSQHIRVLAISLFINSLLVPSFSQAETADQAAIAEQLKALTAAVKELTGTVRKQQSEIDSLKEENASVKEALQANTAAASSSTPAPESAPVTASAPPIGNASAFNPEIGVTADMTAIATESGEDAEGNDKLSVRELELVFGHDVDPYSRLDATVALSDFEDVKLEEAYLTHWGLPFDIGAKVGRLRPKIGKANPVHRDSLDTVDEPLVVANYLGIEGLSRTALELSHYLPTPSENFAHDLTLGFMEGGIGEEGSALGDTTRIPTYYTHYRTSYDVSDRTNMELGGTYLLGSSDDDSKYEVNLFGANATLIHHFNPINRVKLQAEAFFQDRDEPAVIVEHSDDEEDEEHEEEHEEDEHHEEEFGDSDSLGFDSSPFGYYLLSDYRLSKRFGLGARYDYVQPTNGSEGPRDADIGYSTYLTLFQSEFARWRLQYQHLDFAEGGNDNRYFLQGTFAIGVHKHALQ